jgi:hypothetical protein
VVEQEVSRGNFHPFKERKGKRPLRSEQLKIKEVKTCARSGPGQHLSEVLRDSRLEAFQAQGVREGRLCFKSKAQKR